MPSAKNEGDCPLEVYELHMLPLPYVEGRPHRGPQATFDGKEYHFDVDDSVDVSVCQLATGKPYANLEFLPAGPVGPMSILGFGPDELRRLGKFLIECADDLDARFGK